ncbi:MurR/RpiR family transcriptional regulator [Leucobacter sp. CSA1]|uniref:MurR/RpiR family transcriptional regulator n=1 Tax=Leucobacter chromiisoli TaxID=2796471 RepID=A0A934UUH9_9MICO|nr:MurR/RpiR family transcriptional regulator [Leucobacter chromiisoli]MBK0418835.1 MurR/RpiR family transcriptional regulator [Leucobacter chromiisoli]
MEPFVTSDTDNRALTKLRDRIADRWNELSKSERAVCSVLTAMSAERLLYASAAELGSQSRTSNATAVRTLQSLGYSGLSELKHEVAAPFSSSVAPDIRLRQRLEHVGQDLRQIQREVWAEAEELVQLGRGANNDERYSVAVNLIVHADTVFCYGLGASGIASEHLALRLRRIGVSTRRLATDGFRLADEVMSLGSRDLLVVFAPGRVTRDIEALLDQAQLVGASVLLITDELHEQLAPRVTASLTAPHTPTGLTAEGLAGILVSDVLVQAVSAVGPDTALRSSQLLNDLRARLGY